MQIDIYLFIFRPLKYAGKKGSIDIVEGLPNLKSLKLLLWAGIRSPRHPRRLGHHEAQPKRYKNE